MRDLKLLLDAECIRLFELRNDEIEVIDDPVTVRVAREMSKLGQLQKQAVLSTVLVLRVSTKTTKEQDV